MKKWIVGFSESHKQTHEWLQPYKASMNKALNCKFRYLVQNIPIHLNLQIKGMLYMLWSTQHRNYKDLLKGLSHLTNMAHRSLTQHKIVCFTDTYYYYGRAKDNHKALQQLV